MIGVLGIQGSFSLHLASLGRLHVEATLVKKPADLEGCAGLVLPGGESTVLSKFLEETGLGEVLRARAAAGDLALFGTCAGAIVLGKEPADGPPPVGRQPLRLGLADVEVRRNAYGRQIDSFRAPLAIERGVEGGSALEGVFIRAPRFGRLGERVEVLAREGAEPVLVRDGRVLLATFHPELTDDPRVHRYFVEKV